jgi:hypothetical protein
VLLAAALLTLMAHAPVYCQLITVLIPHVCKTHCLKILLQLNDLAEDSSLQQIEERMLLAAVQASIDDEQRRRDKVQAEEARSRAATAQDLLSAPPSLDEFSAEPYDYSIAARTAAITQQLSASGRAALAARNASPYFPHATTVVDSGAAAAAASSGSTSSSASSSSGLASRSVQGQSSGDTS